MASRRCTSLQQENLVKNVALIVLRKDRYGHVTLDKSYWKYLINGIGNTPPPPPGPTPSQITKRSQPPSPPCPICPSKAPPTSHPPRQRKRPSPIPSTQEAPTPLRPQKPRCDTDGLGKTRRDYLGIIMLTKRPTNREIKISNRHF